MSGTGECYNWALFDAAKNGGVLVHGWCNNPITGTYGHAWVERDGMIYDWQSCVESINPCPMTPEEFDKKYLPHEYQFRYPSNTIKLVKKAYEEKNYGPWEPDPWAQKDYVPRTPYAHIIAKDLYRGTSTGNLGGSNLGVLGAGVYLTWDKGVAQGFARIAADRAGGIPKVETFSVKPSLKLVIREGEDGLWNSVMKSLGVNPWDNVDDETFSVILTRKFQEAGYDGVISPDPYDGLVIFDSDNVIGYTDPAKCACGKRKLHCKRCDHWWCAFGCEKKYDDCPECSICKKCDNDELEECYDCKNLWCTECLGHECPKGCDF